MPADVLAAEGECSYTKDAIGHRTSSAQPPRRNTSPRPTERNGRWWRCRKAPMTRVMASSPAAGWWMPLRTGSGALSPSEWPGAPNTLWPACARIPSQGRSYGALRRLRGTTLNQFRLSAPSHSPAPTKDSGHRLKDHPRARSN